MVDRVPNPDRHIGLMFVFTTQEWGQGRRTKRARYQDYSQSHYRPFSPQYPDSPPDDDVAKCYLKSVDVNGGRRRKERILIAYINGNNRTDDVGYRPSTPSELDQGRLS